MAVPHDAVAAVRQLKSFHRATKAASENQYLRQHSAGAFTRDFSQGIVDRFRLTERDDGVISTESCKPDVHVNTSVSEAMIFCVVCIYQCHVIKSHCCSV
jgi:hypothetical protein